MKIIVGLGNPGKEYANSRHNIGFMCMDYLTKHHSFGEWERRQTVALCQGQLQGIPVVLAKPRTYVNLSGQAATYLLSRFRAKPQDLLVVHDDLDLPLGKIRIRPGGSAGGHNGIRSIIESIGTQEFARIRLGIGRPPEDNAVDHVLGRFTSQERTVIQEAVEKAAEAVACILTDGFERAMNKFNQ